MEEIRELRCLKLCLKRGLDFIYDTDLYNTLGVNKHWIFFKEIPDSVMEQRMENPNEYLPYWTLIVPAYEGLDRSYVNDLNDWGIGVIHVWDLESCKQFLLS